MTEPSEPLSPQLQALLDLERPGVLPPEAASDRIWQGLRTALPPERSSPRPAPRPAPRRLLGRLRRSSLPLFTFGLGAAAGAATHAWLGRPLPVTAPAVLSAAPTPAPVEGLPPLSLPAPAAAPPSPMRRPAPLPAAPPRRHDSPLSEERALVEQARSALLRGDGQGALAAVEEHARRFRGGTLSEERDALRIQALGDLNRRPEAKAAAAAFRARYPQSLFLPAIDLATEAPR